MLNAVAHWASIGEYLLWRLFGQWQASYSMASWTGLLNRHSLTWDEEWLSMLPVEAAQFSPLGDVNRPMRGLQGEWANRWPTLRDVPWFPAIGDGAAANIGSGCGDASRLALTIGTTGAMRVVLPSNLPVMPPGLWLYRADANRALLGGATTEGGSVFAWLRDTLQLPPTEELERQLAAMPPAAHGLTMLPFIGGEHAPGWRDDARASLVGFSMNTSPVEIVQAGLESVAYRFALIYGLIANNLPQGEHQIVAGGGVLNSPAWLQIFANVLGQPVLTLVETEATSRGAALLALESLGVIGSTMDLSPETGKTYRPNAEHYARYQEAIVRQVNVYNRLLGE